MPYTLKTSGIALNLVSCVAVDDDDTIKDFKGAAITLGSGVAASVATGSWKSVARKYFVTTANGSFSFFGVTWNATRPTVAEDDSDGMSVWFACDGASAELNAGPFVQINTSPFDQPQGLRRSANSGPITYTKSGGSRAVGTTSLPTNGTTRFSAGMSYRSAVSSEAFYGLESGSLASEATAGSDGGFGTTPSLVAIGGCDGHGNQPFKPYCVAVFNRLLNATEMQSLHDDWFGVLFETGPAATTDQEGARFGADDGSESAHTWLAAQDANVTHPLATNLLLRLAVNATLDPASVAYTLRYQKNGSGGYLAVPVGSGVAEDIGTASYNALGAGSSATNTTSHTVNYPSMTGATSKTALFLVATGRSNTDNTEFAVTGGGWTIVGTLEGGTGTWAADTGTRRVTIFRKDTVTGSESGTITVTLAGTTANTIRGSIVRVEPPSQDHNIETAFASGADTTHGTGYSATASSNLTFLAGDLLLIAAAQNIDTGTQSAQSITATDVTFGTRTNRASTAITGGNDHRHIVDTVPVSSVTGTPNVAPTYAYTISAAGSGPTAFLRIRARRPAVTNELYVAPSSNIAAGGEATTARLTAPAGKTTSDFITGRRWDDENGSDSIDLTTDDYTEVEWALQAQSPAVNGDYFDFRVYAGASALSSYTVTPRWTLGSGGPPPVTSMPPPRRRFPLRRLLHH